jgi:CBS domain containing-hemolysin-like protein
VNPWLSFAVVVLLIGANGFWVAVEFSLVAVDRNRMEARAAESWRGRVVVGLLRRLSFHLSGAQFGITVSSLLLGFLAEPLVAQLLTPLIGDLVGPGFTILVALALATVFQMVVGELIPKNIAIARPEGTALVLGPVARVVDTAASPLIRFFNASANATVRRFGMEPQEELLQVRSLEEIEYLIRSSGETGALPPDALALLTRTIRFGDKVTADALTPRFQVVSLPVETTVAELVDRAVAEGYTRFPIHGADLDDIRGVVHLKEVFSIPPDQRERRSVASIMVDPFVVPESRELLDLLGDLRSSGEKLAVVVDEHGGTAGIVTLEDILEEIVGEIDDEYDETAAVTVATEPGVFVIAGTLHPDEVVEACGFEVPEGEYETVAGFVLDRLGRLPEPGEELEWDGWRIEVVEMDRRRIASLQLTEPEAAADPGDEGHGAPDQGARWW